MYYATGNSPEGVYKEAFAKGTDTPDAFRARCAGYGLTKAKHGSSWDDKCVAYEHQHKRGPFAAPVTRAAIKRPVVAAVFAVGGALLLWKVLR